VEIDPDSDMLGKKSTVLRFVRPRGAASAKMCAECAVS